LAAVVGRGGAGGLGLPVSADPKTQGGTATVLPGAEAKQQQEEEAKVQQ
jgi:hypothetical protein